MRIAAVRAGSLTLFLSGGHLCFRVGGITRLSEKDAVSSFFLGTVKIAVGVSDQFFHADIPGVNMGYAQTCCQGQVCEACFHADEGLAQALCNMRGFGGLFRVETG